MSNNYKHDYEIRDDERVAIFIDGSNLYHSLEENCRRYDVDFGAFSAKLPQAGRISGPITTTFCAIQTATIRHTRISRNS